VKLSANRLRHGAESTLARDKIIYHLGMQRAAGRGREGGREERGERSAVAAVAADRNWNEHSRSSPSPHRPPRPPLINTLETAKWTNRGRAAGTNNESPEINSLHYSRVHAPPRSLSPAPTPTPHPPPRSAEFRSSLFTRVTSRRRGTIVC